MVSLPIHDQAGQVVGQYELDPAELAPSINRQLLHDAVVMYQANARQGTHRTKSRAEVAGSTKKMYRQKGTGRARAGSRRAGQRRGGGHVFARRSRDYSYRLPRKAVRLATRMALASKIQDEQVVVIDQLAFDAPRTKSMASIIKALGLADQSLLVATEGIHRNVYMSGRNIAGVSVSPACDLNALNVLTPQRLLVTKGALDWIRSQAATASSGEKAAEAGSE